MGFLSFSRLHVYYITTLDVVDLHKIWPRFLHSFWGESRGFGGKHVPPLGVIRELTDDDSTSFMSHLYTHGRGPFLGGGGGSRPYAVSTWPLMEVAAGRQL